MQPSDDLGAFATLDLALIKRKLMHVKTGKGWDEARANAVEIEYRRFLYLMKKFPQEQLAPPKDVDTFWHYHILDTRKYARDCETLFGHFLHHRPNLGLGDAKADGERRGAGDRLRLLYDATFARNGELPVNAIDGARFQTSCAAAAETAYCAAPEKTAHRAVAATKTAYCAAAIGEATADCATEDKAACCAIGSVKSPASAKHAAMPEVA